MIRYVCVAAVLFGSLSCAQVSDSAADASANGAGADARADGPYRADLGPDVWVSPEACPRHGVGVVEGYPCAVVGAECAWACGQAIGQEDFIYKTKCVEGVWVIIRRDLCGH